MPTPICPNMKIITFVQPGHRDIFDWAKLVTDAGYETVQQVYDAIQNEHNFFDRFPLEEKHKRKIAFWMKDKQAGMTPPALV